MTSEAPLQDPGYDALSRLGEGSRGDRLSLRVIVSLLWRCLSMLRPVRRHIVQLVLGFLALVGVAFPISIVLLDTFWTRALQGRPLDPGLAALLGYAPEIAVHVNELSPEIRRALVRTVVAWSGGLLLVMLPIVIGLYYYQVWILQRINQVLRVDLLDQLQALSLRFHSDNPVGDALYRLYQDSAMVTQLVQVLFLEPMWNLGRVLFTAAILSIFSVRAALLFVVVVPALLVIAGVFARPMRVGFRRARETNSALTSKIQETLAGIQVIKAYGAEGAKQHEFETASRSAFDEAFTARSRFAFYQVAVFWLLGGAAIVAIADASLATRDGSVLNLARLLGVGAHGDGVALPAAITALGITTVTWTIGLYNVFKDRAGDMTGAGRNLFRMWGRLQDVAIGLDRVFEVLDLEPDVQDDPSARPLESVRDKIAFEDVHFAYAPDRPVLEGIDLEARVGTITAIVGPTGSGKSTLMALLLRLFDPTQGRVTIDAEPLHAFTLDSLRSSVSIALQENVLFGETIRENIRFAVPEAGDDAVAAAARVACADEFIETLPEGFDTPLGERGSRLSTGQRQRLSIARAVLKDTPILVLDEPTASLDASTELKVMENLQAWGRGRAIFLITHRLSTIRQADQIAYLRSGRIEELGSHDELMRKPDGAYRALVEAELAGLEQAGAGRTASNPAGDADPGDAPCDREPGS
jgi:ABC-type multidrug transport system fused ATPase/permease subunit